MRNKEKNKRHKQCKECYQEHRANYYTEHYEKYKVDYLARAKKRREELRQEYRINLLNYLKGKGCEDCGEEDVRVLEFDHINPKTKSFSVSQGVKLGHSWSVILDEIQKCQILCSNCHKKRTAGQYGWYKSQN